ncbi:MAG: anti-sigma factor family protein [Gemmatimonadales bacterium]
MNQDQWTDRLSEYLDGELAAGERSALEAHLAACADCSATLEELRRVVARARLLEDRPPAANLWPGIAARLTPGRRVSFSVPQLLAASIALVLLSGGGVWLALRPPAQSPLQQAFQGPSPATMQSARWARTDAAVAELQDALARNEARLDTATVRVVRQSLALIDKAIDQARRALAADPGNAYLNLHLADTMRRKVELLRRANELAAAQS